MPVYDRGKLRFESRLLDGTAAKPLVKVIEYDCYKPPVGTVTDFRPALTVKPVVDARFLQPNTTTHMLEGATNTGAAAPTITELKDDLISQFGFGETTVDRANIPQNWKQVVPCFKTTILYNLACDVYEITARVKGDATLGGVNYPDGDTVEQFRILVPQAQYTFVRRKEPNPNCCPVEEGTGISEDTSDSFPPLQFELDEDFDWNDWRWGLRYRWNLDDSFRLRLRYRYRYEDD